MDKQVFCYIFASRIRFPTSYHNKAVIAEGVKPILPLRWEFFFIHPLFYFQITAHPIIQASGWFEEDNKEHNAIKKGVQPKSL